MPRHSSRIIARDRFGTKVFIHTYESPDGEVVRDLHTDGRVLLDVSLAHALIKKLTEFIAKES
jgi:hypothetical protein